LGRETKPFRQGFQEVLDRLRKEVKDPLIDVDRKESFDQLVEAWASELGAMSYAESFKVLDLMLIISVLDNRKKVDEMNQRIEVLEEKLSSIFRI
jgi:BMFP domain-containing protein YqiC